MPHKRNRKRKAEAALVAAALEETKGQIEPGAVAPQESEPKTKSETNMSNGQRIPYTDGIPLEAITELCKSTVTVGVKIFRFIKERPALIYAGVQFETRNLADIDAWCRSMAGGGTFGIHVFDLENPLSELLPPFKVFAEGLPQTPRNLDGSLGPPPEWDARADMRGMGMPTGAPAWAQPGGGGPNGGMPPSMRGGYPGATSGYQGGYPGNGGGFGAAARAGQHGQGQQSQQSQFGDRTQAERVLENQTNKYEQALAQQSQQIQALTQQLAADRAEAVKREAALERQRAEERHRADMKGLESKFEMMMSQMQSNQNRPQQQERQGTDINALLLGLVPVFVEMVRGNSSSSNKTMELLLAARGNGGGDPFDQLAKITPLVTQLAGGKSGGRDAEVTLKLLNQMTESQMNNAMLGAELVKSFAEKELPPESPAIQLVKQVLESSLTLGAAYFKDKEEQANRETQEKRLEASRAKALEAQTAQAKATAEAQTAQAKAATASAAAATAQAAQTAANAAAGTGASPQPSQPAAAPAPTVTKLSIDPSLFAMLPKSLQTQQWKKLLTQLHTENAKTGEPAIPPAEMAAHIAHYLEHLVIFDELPMELNGIRTDIAGTLETAFSLLPVGKSHPQYLRAVLDGIVRALVGDQPVQQPAPQQQQQQPQSSAQQVVNGHNEEAAEEDEEGSDDVVRYPT